MPGVSLQCFKVAETELNPDDERERRGVGRAEGPTSVVAVEGEGLLQIWRDIKLLLIHPLVG